MQDTQWLRILRERHGSASRKMSLGADEPLLHMHAMRARVRAALRVRFSRDRFCTVWVPRSFTTVRSGVPDSRTSWFVTQSEYAQPLVAPKLTLFDINIECWRYFGAHLRGAVTSLRLGENGARR